MYLMPTTLATRRAEEKEFESFGELLSYLVGTSHHKIKRIWAVSAYYDRPSIEQLIEYIKSRSSKKQKPELLIIIGSINSRELEALQKMIFGKLFKEGSGIRVTNCGYLFHSKGYLVETANRSGMCAIGSMNLTQAGLTKNEEFLTYSQYKHSKVPPLVASFKEYIEAYPLDEWSKEIGAVSDGEKGIRWLRKSHPRDKSTQKHEELVQENESTPENEFVQGDDSNGLLSATKLREAPPFPDIADEVAVQRYFGKERLNFSRANDSKFINEREFTLAFYKLIFEECRKNPKYEHDYEHGEVTLQYRDALWRRNSKYPYQTTRHQATCSVRFDVTLKDEGLMTCYTFIYPLVKKLGFRHSISLGVHVENKQKKPVNVLQLNISKLGWEKIWNDKGQYWEIYSDATMGKVEQRGQVKREEVLSAVRKAERGGWIKKPSWSKKELVHLGKLPVAEKVTWRNSGDFLAQLLHYAIIRAKLKS